MATLAAGTLILVVGPSGSGKDTLIAGASAALAGDARFVFARRVITRPAAAGGEDHEPISEQEFVSREHRAGFLITWRAHGLAYGLPSSLANDLADGRNVIAGVSRTVLVELLRRYPGARIVEITAPPATIATRLAARGREDAAGVAERLARHAPSAPAGADVVTIVNDAAPEAGVAKFVTALQRAA